MRSLDLIREENTAETKEMDQKGTATKQDQPAACQTTIQDTDLGERHKSADGNDRPVKHSSDSPYKPALNSASITGSTQTSMMLVEKKSASATGKLKITSSLSKASKQAPKSVSRSAISSVNSSRRFRSIKHPQESVKKPPAQVKSNASSSSTFKTSSFFLSVLEEGKPTKPLKKSGWRVGNSPYSMQDDDS